MIWILVFDSFCNRRLYTGNTLKNISVVFNCKVNPQMHIMSFSSLVDPRKLFQRVLLSMFSKSEGFPLKRDWYYWPGREVFHQIMEGTNLLTDSVGFVQGHYLTQLARKQEPEPPVCVHFWRDFPQCCEMFVSFFLRHNGKKVCKMLQNSFPNLKNEHVRITDKLQNKIICKPTSAIWLKNLYATSIYYVEKTSYNYTLFLSWFLSFRGILHYFEPKITFQSDISKSFLLPLPFRT